MALGQISSCDDWTLAQIYTLALIMVLVRATCMPKYILCVEYVGEDDVTSFPPREESGTGNEERAGKTGDGQ